MRNSKFFRDCFGIFVVEVIHQQRQPQLCWQGLYGPVQIVIFNCLVLSPGSPSRQNHPELLFSADRVHGQVFGNSQDPRPEPLTASKLSYFQKTFQQSILGDVLSIIHVTQYAQAEGKNISVVPSDKDAICTFVSSTARGNQNVIRKPIQSSLLATIKTNGAAQDAKKSQVFKKFSLPSIAAFSEKAALHPEEHKAAQIPFKLSFKKYLWLTTD